MKANTISPVMSDLFYRVALGFEGPFTLEDITPLSNAERRRLAQRWLDLLVERGELMRFERRITVSYRWVNW